VQWYIVPVNQQAQQNQRPGRLPLVPCVPLLCAYVEANYGEDDDERGAKGGKKCRISCIMNKLAANLFNA
jgi:hypothetical protein